MKRLYFCLHPKGQPMQLFGHYLYLNLYLLRGDILSNLDSPLYSDSRPPLSYILHLTLNPFNFLYLEIISDAIYPSG